MGLASSRWRPGMLLNILHCTVEPSSPQCRIMQPQMSVVLRLRNLTKGKRWREKRREIRAEPEECQRLGVVEMRKSQQRASSSLLCQIRRSDWDKWEGSKVSRHAYPSRRQFFMRVGENCLQAAEGAKKLLTPLPKPELSVVRISSLLSLREPQGGARLQWCWSWGSARIEGEWQITDQVTENTVQGFGRNEREQSWIECWEEHSNLGMGFGSY